MTADGPGQTTISDPKDTTSLTNKDPGSEIKGVPASETKAKSFPEDNFKMMSFSFFFSENLWYEISLFLV